MREHVFLVFSRDGFLRSTKRAPTLSHHEIGVQLRITIPDESFRAPLIVADVNVLDSAILQPAVAVTVVEPPPPEPEETHD